MGIGHVASRCISGCVVVALVCSGCSTHRADLSVSSARDLDLWSTESIAVLPIQGDHAVVLQQMMVALADSIRLDRPSTDVLGPQEAANRIRSEGLTSEYTEFLVEVRRGAVLDAKITERLRRTLSADAALTAEVLSTSQVDGSTTFLGGTKGTTRATIQVWLLDLTDGRILWAASSEGLRRTAYNGQPAPPLHEALTLAMEEVTAKRFRGRDSVSETSRAGSGADGGTARRGR